MKMLVKPIHKIINLYSNERDFNLAKSRFLDIGCGSGDAVKELLDFGIDAYGVDIGFKAGKNLDSLVSNGRLQLIELEKYRVPFEDNYFDVVYADQVVEHVQDINTFIDEVFRVLKPDGFFVAYFPSKYKPIEPHVGIPLGGLFSASWYIRCCVFIGAYYQEKSRKSDHANIKASKIKAYLDQKTCYRTKFELSNKFWQKFSVVKYREDLLLDSISRISAKLIRSMPLGTRIFGFLWSHLLIADKSEFTTK